MNFGTKADTLSKLDGNLTKGTVLPQICFTVEQWIGCKSVDSFFAGDSPAWLGDVVIVRSSAKKEDSSTESWAGHFVSVGSVCGNKQLEEAINRVVDSFEDGDPDNQVFIQPMLENVLISGVAFTLDPNNSSHYYVINYDDKTGKTNTVTDGSSNKLKTIYLSKHNKSAGIKWLDKLINMLEELEQCFDSDSLDVEFAFDYSDVLYLLQVRPLIASDNKKMSIEKHKQLLESIEEYYRLLSGPHPYLLGEKSIFGVMPDWNPAEIIGIRPQPLALSLYKKLVTDRTWAYQRHNYGYRNLRSFPLMVAFAGLPYIDVRVSFNSFIPSDLDESLAKKLVEYYISKLEGKPSSHDKVEFDIIYSCYTLDLPERIKELEGCGFSRQECEQISDSLRKLTNNIVCGENALWKKDVKKLDKLKLRQESIKNSSLSKIEKIYWLLEDCGRYGTLPFAGLARAGFIALQMLKSLVSSKIITVQEYDSFMVNLKTVSSSISADIVDFSRDNFLSKYGHLRPGTYDILSPRYDSEPNKYFDWESIGDSKEEKHEDFSLSLGSMNQLSRLLNDHDLDLDVIGIFNFIKDAIEGREYAKFVFTKSLSDSLELIKQLGEDYGFTKEDMAYFNIDGIYRLCSEGGDPKEILSIEIMRGKKIYDKSKSIVLPSMITSPSDIWFHELSESEPNFITMKSIEGKVINKDDDRDLFSGNILFIPNADPGYDWVFSHNIGGFVTMYGGVNSHMAIRAGELGIPAVIGSGELLYKKWCAAYSVEIDCANKAVKILQS